jgi:phosphohistidine swiveling domain-containing protein
MKQSGLIKPLKDVRMVDASVVGGKGASLGELLAAGFPVPNGFIILAEASKYAKDSLPTEVQKEILDAFNKLKTKKVAVRSSALAEDSVDASWAGQFESFLNVGGDHLLETIKECWQSAQSGRAVAYAACKHAADHGAVAVVVQEMVDSAVSGVLFTINPIKHDHQLIIESSYGLGEMVVQGKVTPDRFAIDKQDLSVTQRQINSKNMQLIMRGDKNIEISVAAKLRNRSSLSDDTLQALARLGIAIEEHYNKPQDIEWAVEGDNIIILQSRPLTTLNSKTVATQTTATPILIGLGASPGIATGKVRVIKSHTDNIDAQKGEILVAPQTTPEFTEIFGKMAAVITDTGGMASHAAIVARELDMPAVVATGEATNRLKNGDRITIDGYSGHVYMGNVEITIQEMTPESNPIVSSTGNDIDDMVNSLVSDPMDTREFWPLAPGSLMSYFDVDQAVDMYDKLDQLLKEGWSFARLATIFKRAQLVRYFLVNSGLVGIKVARGLQITPLTVADQIKFAGWFVEILKQFQPDDPFNLKGKNAVWPDKQAVVYAASKDWHETNDQAREILNLASTQLFTLNWSFYGDYYGPDGFSMHGPYPVTKGRTLLVKEYFRAPTEIWDLGHELPYDHLVIAQQYEGVDLWVNYSNRLLNKNPVSKYTIAYRIVKDGNEISLDELQVILKIVGSITKRQTNYVESMPDMEKVRKWAQLAHKDLYLHFGKEWYNKEAVEWMIDKFGDQFLTDIKLAKPSNRPLEYRKKLWDPRNDYYPGSES